MSRVSQIPDSLSGWAYTIYYAFIASIADTADLALPAKDDQES